MPDLTVLAANLHNERQATNYLRRHSRADAEDSFDIALVSEAHRRRRQLRRMPGHDYATGHQRGPSQETGILLASHLPDHGHGCQRVSEALPRFERVGKERWGQAVVTEVRGVPLTVVTVHPVAGPESLSGTDPEHPLVRAYTDAMGWLDATIAAAVAQGHEVIVGGDLQMWPGWDQPWSVARVITRHQLRAYWHRIDLIAWTPGLVQHGRGRHFDIGSDHDALAVDLSITPHRKNRK